MAPTAREFTLPDERFRLEEINMPEELAAAPVGQSVDLEVIPEAPSRAPRIDLDNNPGHITGFSGLAGEPGTNLRRYSFTT